MKKTVSILLGLAMLMSLSVSAWAATSDTIDKESLRVGYGEWPEEVQETTGAETARIRVVHMERTQHHAVLGLAWKYTLLLIM